MRGWVVVALVAGWSVRAAADPAEADRLVAEGEELARGGQLAEAVATFKRAEAAQARALHDCYIALAYHRMGRDAQASAFVARCKTRSAEGQDRAPDWADKLGLEIWKTISAAGFGRVTVATTPAEAAISVGDFDADEQFEPGDFWLPPGEHTFTVTSPGYVTRSETVNVERKGKVPLTVELTREEAPAPIPTPIPTPPATEPTTRSRPVWAYATVAAGATFLVAGGIYNYKAWRTRQEAEESALDYDRVIERWRFERTMTVGFYAAGAAAAGIGVYLLWRHAHTAQEPALTGVSVGEDGAQVWTGWTF